MLKLYLLFLLLFSLILAGCGTVKVIDKNESDLMPKSIAMSIFEKYGFKQWAEKPFVINSNNNTKEFIEFNKIDSAKYFPRSKSLWFCYKSSLLSISLASFNNVTESQALELTNAVRALGATSIERLQWLN